MNTLGRGGTERYGRFRRSRARRRYRGRARRHRGGPGRQVRGAGRGRPDRRRIPLPGLPAVELAAAVREPGRGLGGRGRAPQRGDRRAGRFRARAAAGRGGRHRDPRHRPDHRPRRGGGGAWPRTGSRTARAGPRRWPTPTWSSRPGASRSRRPSRACPTSRPGPPPRACARPTCRAASSCSAAGRPCELAQIFAAFGSQVTLIEAEAGLLPGEAAFAGEILTAALRRSGVEIFLGSPATKAERTPDGLTLALEDGTRIDADRLLLATGRRPRLTGLGLDALGIAVAPGQALPTTAACQVVSGVDRRRGMGGGGRHRDHPHPRQPLPGRRGRGQPPRPAPRGGLQRDPALRVHRAFGLRRGRTGPGRSFGGASPAERHRPGPAGPR